MDIVNFKLTTIIDFAVITFILLIQNNISFSNLNHAALLNLLGTMQRFYSVHSKKFEMNGNPNLNQPGKKIIH